MIIRFNSSPVLEFIHASIWRSQDFILVQKMKAHHFLRNLKGPLETRPGAFWVSASIYGRLCICTCASACLCGETNGLVLCNKKTAAEKQTKRSFTEMLLFPPQLKIGQNRVLELSREHQRRVRRHRTARDRPLEAKQKTFAD